MKRGSIRNKVIAFLLFCFVTGVTYAQTTSVSSPNRKALHSQLATGWNTWNTESVLSHVLLPEGFQIKLSLKEKGIHPNQSLQQVFLSSKKPIAYKTVPVAHAHNGSYTALELEWNNSTYLVETATDGKEWVAAIQPQKVNNTKLLIVEAGFIWNKEGDAQKKEDVLRAKTSSGEIQINSNNQKQQTNDLVNYASSPYLSFDMNTTIFLYTGKEKKTNEELLQLIAEKKKAHEQNISSHYSANNATYAAIQNIMAWNTIYEPYTNAVITPVSRNWNDFFGSHVLFCWDTYFGSMLASLDNKELAYANAIEITHSARQMPKPFVPNYKNPYGGSFDRSQPPVGSYAVNFIYEKFQEKWFLEEVYSDLLKWNEWWWEDRRTPENYLCWGSPVSGVAVPDGAENTMLGAKYESGLDNSPMYETANFNKETGLMELGDVGLMSLYILDCDNLMAIAKALGKKSDIKEIKKRKETIAKQLATMWNEETQIFNNFRTDSKEFDLNISPTNFYPLFTDVPTQVQAEAMMEKHYFNEEEFYGEWVLPSTPKNSPYFEQDYWRGRIWGPMNFLVYLGLKKYGLEKAKNDLVEKSEKLLMQNWEKHKGIYENFNSTEGEGRLSSEPITHSDSYYHWGGLLGLMKLLENN